MSTFSALSLIAPLQRALAEVGYVEMTPVQEAAVPAILDSRDVIAQAKTGSGKTAAFALGLLSTLEPTARQLQGLVLCPTRELADQVSREIRRLASFIPNVQVLTLCGGIPVRIHLASLAHPPHIAVGTPGRILDLLRKGALAFGTLKTLVLDEADRMLDMGFAEDLCDIIEQAPTQRQTLLFSATIPDAIRDFSRQFQHAPLDLTVTSDAEDTALIEQRFVAVESAAKLDVLAALLLALRPESALVFCNTRDTVRLVDDDLTRRGFAVLSLHGELEQREREERLVRFANHSSNVLVASDVAARGLDIRKLAMVVNFDIASDLDSHIHRIGRTGRAGHRGVALTLCTPRDAARVEQIARQQDSPLEWSEPPIPSGGSIPLQAPFATLVVDAGRQDKIRPGDVLGALTGEAAMPGAAVGKIDVFATRTYVAVAREWSEKALQRLRTGKIKGRTYRIRPLHR